MSAVAEDVIEESVDQEEETSSEDLFNEFAGGDVANEEELKDEEDPADPKPGEGEEDPANPELDEDKEKLEDDPWANVPDDIKAEYQRLQDEAAAWKHKVKSEDGRVSALQKKINALEAAQQEAAITPETFAKAFTDKDSWKEFAEYNPEIAATLESFMSGMAEATQQNIDSLKETQEHLLENATRTANIDADAVITEQFPEWKSWIATNDFIEWLDTLPPTMRNIVDDGELDESLYLIGSYETYLKANGKMQEPSDQGETTEMIAKTQEKRNKQLKDGATTPSKGGSAKPISEADTGSLFDYFAEKRK